MRLCEEHCVGVVVGVYLILACELTSRVTVWSCSVVARGLALLVCIIGVSLSIRAVMLVYSRM